ncbi:MAG: polyamine aminopropyltransferase [Acidobacteriota bacterium]
MRPSLVYVTVLVIATCGLVYELVAGTLASYLLGDSVTQFSVIIGVYLSAPGLGSFLSRYVGRGLARRFVDVELGVALVGGWSAPILFLAFGRLPTFFRPVLYSVVVIVGTLVGLEIPLVLRLLKETVDFRDLVAQVLTFDYLGALVASLLFPMLLMPKLGLVRTSLLFGLANGAVGLWSTWLFAPLMPRVSDLRAKAVLVLALLTGGYAYADRLTDLAEEEVYADPVVFAETTPYQRIVITRTRTHFQLFLNGQLQFSSADEYRYHEALVHPAFDLVPGARRVLVLGGGDGLAVREILKHPGVQEIVLVDLDRAMTELAKNHPLVTELNERSLWSPKVRVVNADAYVWLQEGGDRFDLAFVDFPDPHSFAIGKLYTTRFYRMLARRLDPGGAAAIQSTSPLLARRSFWCIDRTLRAAGFHTRPYHALVPSFGEWGFVLATREERGAPSDAPPGLRYLDRTTLASLFVIGPDMAPVDGEINRLDNQVLVRTYEDEWRHWE